MKRVKTRYFLFWRVKPKPRDYQVLYDACKQINAFFAYKTHNDGTRPVLKGYIILHKNTTCATGRTLHRYFPNFLLTCVPSKFHFNFEDLNKEEGVIVVGTHPFDDIRKELFKRKSLTHFWNKDFILDGNTISSYEYFNGVRKWLFK